MGLQVFDHGEDEGFILVVFCEFQGRKVWQPADMVDKPLNVELHFQGAVPVFEGEHGAPVEPKLDEKNSSVNTSEMVLS